uniref:Uncharacterized protein n=1 Tax=Steinernema glaseri TaxID=37863 RepID=A0A1I7Y597_9BILA
MERERNFAARGAKKTLEVVFATIYNLHSTIPNFDCFSLSCEEGFAREPVTSATSTIRVWARLREIETHIDRSACSLGVAGRWTDGRSPLTR